MVCHPGDRECRGDEGRDQTVFEESEKITTTRVVEELRGWEEQVSEEGYPDNYGCEFDGQPLDSGEKDGNFFFESYIPDEHHEEDHREDGCALEDFADLGKMVPELKDQLVVDVEFVPDVDVESDHPDCEDEQAGSAKHGEIFVELLVLVISIECVDGKE